MIHYSLLLHGQTDQAELTKQAQNPIANLISLPLQNNIEFGLGAYNRTKNTLNIQPIYPIALGERLIMINRFIIPILWQPDLSMETGSTSGLGDINYTPYFSPVTPSALTWGIGPVMIFPTASDPSLGSGKFSVGPSVVLVYMLDKWMFLSVMSNWWSVAGDEARADVSVFYWQPGASHFLAKHWYLTSAPIITANWEAPADERWTVPIGGGGGKNFKIGNQAMDAQIQVFYYLASPQSIDQEWSLRLQLKFLFPK